MNVLMISPGFPVEQPFFTRGLSQVGARVIGLGDQPEGNLPPMARSALSAYYRVNFGDEGGMVAEAHRIASQVRIDRVECLWESLMLPAARIRESLGLPGMSVAETVPFRDKEEMKKVLDKAGIRTPRHASATTIDQVREAAHWIGFPIIVKPIAGAGSMDTYKVANAEELDKVLRSMHHVPEVSVEEFVEGEDFTFDTICANGKILFYNVSFYRPRALVSRSNDWISPQTISLRNVEDHRIADGVRMGRAVLQALGFKTGFTHMEWYRKDNGEAVFGEIGGRPPGARTVDVMNWASDLDLFRGWAEAATLGTFTQPIERKYNSVAVFKRAVGEGKIERYDGLSRLMAEFGEAICAVELTPVGAPKRSAAQSLIGDGFVMLRHPDLQTALHMADRVGTELQLVAG